MIAPGHDELGIANHGHPFPIVDRGADGQGRRLVSDGLYGTVDRIAPDEDRLWDHLFQCHDQAVQRRFAPWAAIDGHGSGVEAEIWLVPDAVSDENGERRGSGIDWRDGEGGIGNQTRVDLGHVVGKVTHREGFPDRHGIEDRKRLAGHRRKNGHDIGEMDGGVDKDCRNAQPGLAQPGQEQLPDSADVRPIDASLSVQDHEVSIFEAAEQLVRPGTGASSHPFVGHRVELVGDCRIEGRKLRSPTPLFSNAPNPRGCR